MRKTRIARIVGTIALCVSLLAFAATVVGIVLPGPSADAQVSGQVPGAASGFTSDSEIWRRIRQGESFPAGPRDRMAGVLVQSEGDNWRAFRNGPLSVWGAWALAGTLVLLGIFYLLRGRIRIDAGPAGRLVERFTGIERFSHWLLAVSFLILGITGLNILYGRYVLIPVIGPEAFSVITRIGKWLHNYVAFAFMLALVLILVLWVRHNLPRWNDLQWLARGGGLLVKGSHPPAHKFNAGQKLVFWSVVLLGFSLSASGVALLFPFEVAMFAKTFAALNVVGFDLPTQLTPMQETQLAQLWHGIVALALLVVALAHIYIGSLGMEGAFDAMGTGMVDANWAKEHHSLWVAELDRSTPAQGGGD